LSGRGLCDELITRPEESYRLCCVVVCDLETSRMGAPYIYDISHLRVKPEISVILRQCYKNYIFPVNVNGNKRMVVSNPIVCGPNLQNCTLVCASMGRRFGKNSDTVRLFAHNQTHMLIFNHNKVPNKLVT